jgi:hypothetical protein
MFNKFSTFVPGNALATRYHPENAVFNGQNKTEQRQKAMLSTRFSTA